MSTESETHPEEALPNNKPALEDGKSVGQIIEPVNGEASGTEEGIKTEFNPHWDEPVPAPDMFKGGEAVDGDAISKQSQIQDDLLSGAFSTSEADVEKIAENSVHKEFTEDPPEENDKVGYNDSEQEILSEPVSEADALAGLGTPESITVVEDVKIDTQDDESLPPDSLAEDENPKENNSEEKITPPSPPVPDYQGPGPQGTASGPQLLASGAANSIWGLGNLVRSAMGINPEQKKERILKRAGENYERNLTRLQEAYTKSNKYIDIIGASEAAQVRDQFKATGKEPPKSIMQNLADNDVFHRQQKELKKSLNDIQHFSKKLGPSAKSAGIDPLEVKEFFSKKNEKLEEKALKLDGISDKDGNLFLESIKNLVEKVSHSLSAFLARTGISSSKNLEPTQ